MTNEEIAVAVQNGQSELMEQLWKQCYGFIRQQAIKWARAWKDRSDFDVDDLTQAGYIALCGAVRGFQEGRGGFLAFLSFCLKTEFSKVAGCQTERQLKDPLNHAASLDAPAYSDTENETTLGDNISVEEAGFGDVEEAVFNQQLASALRQAMNQLPEKQRLVIELYYLHRKTYIEIAEILNCSVSFPQQCTREGFRNIRKGAVAPVLTEMLYGDRNYYRRTGLTVWNRYGISSPEWELLRKEYKMRGRNLRYCVEHLGMTMEQAKRLFPA